MTRIIKGTIGVSRWDATTSGRPSHSDASATSPHAEPSRLYVINLVTSADPMTCPPLRVADFEKLEVYQIAGWSRDRLLFHLRLGPIESELVADAVLAAVCHEYPNATAQLAGDSDMRMFASLPAAAARPRREPPSSATPKAMRNSGHPATHASERGTAADAGKPTSRPAAHRDMTADAPARGGYATAPTPASPIGATRATTLAANRAASPAIASAATAALSGRTGAPPASDSVKHHRSPGVASADRRAPEGRQTSLAHVGRSAPFATSRPSVTAAGPATAVRPASGVHRAPPGGASGAHPASRYARVATADRSSPEAAKFRVRPGTRPAVDSTQTVRALSLPEQTDEQSPKIFAIQLALSSREIRAESVPNLAIFDEYRLYATLSEATGRVVHTLRLGFFSDDVAAQAVTYYLRSFFESAAVIRVSEAERARFAERRMKGRKDGGDSGEHVKIELSSPAEAPATSLAELSARVAAASDSFNPRSKSPRPRNRPRQ